MQFECRMVSWTGVALFGFPKMFLDGHSFYGWPCKVNLRQRIDCWNRVWWTTPLVFCVEMGLMNLIIIYFSIVHILELSGRRYCEGTLFTGALLHERMKRNGSCCIQKGSLLRNLFSNYPWQLLFMESGARGTWGFSSIKWWRLRYWDQRFAITSETPWWLGIISNLCRRTGFCAGLGEFPFHVWGLPF